MKSQQKINDDFFMLVIQPLGNTTRNLPDLYGITYTYIYIFIQCV